MASWEEAAQNAVVHASKSLKNIRSCYINEQTCAVTDGKILDYLVNCKITIEVK
ncbi:dodecin family protein [Patiriisocius sp. Uisw_047]|uniref:dodecin family protein n=1 Tax=Patiriisocius sp. Uisw_047 TaxID=3230969 RepID=UPI0039EABCA7